MTNLNIHWRQAYRELSSSLIPKPLQQNLLIVILLLVLFIRLATINTPQLKWTEWKEIDYLYISQNYWEEGFNFFRPEVSWPAEPPRVTEMELPLVPFTAALLYKLFGFSVYTARGITLFSSLLMIIYVFKLAARELGAFVGLLAAFVSGVLPLYHPFGRLLFTEPTMIALSVVSLYYLAEWVDYERGRDWILALVSFSLTIALKLESLYLFLPIAWIAFRKYRWEVKRYKGLFTLVVLALILPVLWYGYAYYLENTGAHLFGIFAGHNKSQTLFMLSRYRWYRTMAGRIINWILGGYYGTLLFIFGFIVSVKFQKAGLFFAYIIAVGIYFALVAEGNIDAPYRQLTIIPSAGVFVALGSQAIVAFGIAIYRIFLSDRPTGKDHLYIAFAVSLLLIIVIPLMKYKDIFREDIPASSSRWFLAEEINKNSNDQAKLIVIGEYSKHVGGYDLSPILYFYSGRQGWSLTPVDWNTDKVESLKKKGADLLIIVPRYGDYPSAVNYQIEASTDSIFQELKTTYTVLYENQDQIIFDLNRPIK